MFPSSPALAHDGLSGDAAGPVNLPSVQPPSPARPAVPDPEQTRRFLGYLLEPGSCLEIRIFKARFTRTGFIGPDDRYSTTLAGWFDDADAAVADLGRLQGVSAYVTVNPIRDDLLSRTCNRVAKQRSTSADADVAAVRWLYLDLDPVRPADISATEPEHAAALSLRDKILAENPEIAEAAHYGSSGNGAWILVRIEDLDPTEGTKHVGAALDWFARTYSTDAVVVDTATRNPARVMCCVGTIKAKGSDTLKRPWRTATIDSPERPLKAVTLPAWVAGHPATAEAKASRTEPAASPGKPSPGPALRGADVTIRAAAYLDKMEPAISGSGGHRQTFDAACALVKGFGLATEPALRLLQQWNGRCIPPWTERELLHKIEDAIARPGPVGYLLDARPLPGDTSPRPSPGERGSRPAAASEDDPRPAIEITVEHHLILGAAVGALAADPEIFARGDVLVRVPLVSAAETIRADDDPYSAGRLAKAIRVEEPIVSSLLSRNATFYRMRKAKDEEPYPVDEAPPRFLSSAIPALGSWPGMRRLAGITYAPYVRRDGSVVEGPGYDPETEYVYHATCQLVPGPEKPTRDDAMEAAGAILDLVSQFPFAEPDIDGAVWLAMLLTMIQRPAIKGPVPGFVFSGNNAGAGKGLLVDTAGIIAMGKNLQASTYTDDPAEMRKLLFSIALSGCAAVHFDNVENGSTYGCAPLDSAMTAAEISDRILGQSRTASAPFRPVCVLTGNNVSPTADAYRRWAIARLVTNEERPFCREDIRIKDLRAHALANRPALLRDALTILRAHARADRPGGGWAPLGSFGEWDAHIRGAVHFATENDPITTMLETAEKRPERLSLGRLLDAWEECGRRMTVAKAIEESLSNGGMREILAELCGGKTPLNPRTIGRYLAKHCNVVVDGRKLVEDGEFRKATIWAVAKLAPDSPH
ncbi:hypothetical protein OJF2_24970 [Aquisphaera giovannonii]|uniref:Uncharacterized protein n=2 Tax=Aquisphaera giovannonii TaxID=406548 RepID=A0A5B9W157_9BACT|nr:hypothetical protein OJF2_24970 [Aquisphaera giovannonii]